eukprot:Skav200782  [mRNA]  locus=scaffold2001:593247:602418:+ [translate_table: standard]
MTFRGPTNRPRGQLLLPVNFLHLRWRALRLLHELSEPNDQAPGGTPAVALAGLELVKVVRPTISTPSDLKVLFCHQPKPSGPSPTSRLPRSCIGSLCGPPLRPSTPCCWGPAPQPRLPQLRPPKPMVSAAFVQRRTCWDDHGARPPMSEAFCDQPLKAVGDDSSLSEATLDPEEAPGPLSGPPDVDGSRMHAHFPAVNSLARAADPIPVLLPVAIAPGLPTMIASTRTHAHSLVVNSLARAAELIPVLQHAKQVVTRPLVAAIAGATFQIPLEITTPPKRRKHSRVTSWRARAAAS